MKFENHLQISTTAGTTPQAPMRALAGVDFELWTSDFGSVTPLNVLVIPDKFKGTLSAGAAAEAIARGWRQTRPKDKMELLPMCDGGDGFGEVLSRLLGARRQTVKAVDAAHRSCLTGWWWAPRSRTAIIDSAAVIGLAMLQPRRFHPFELDTFGLGLVLQKAAKQGARRCLVGIGGSATNDGGFGLARALGWRFLDPEGQDIEQWTRLPSLARLRPPRRRRWFQQLVVAVDVKNPLLGPRGATRVYGPQKGLRPEDFEEAERCLHQIAKVVRKQTGRDLARIPGAGAAGGLGFGFLAFVNGRLQPGFALFARLAGLEQHLRRANLVITGEGAIDASTLMGKGVGQVAQRCRDLNVDCIGLGGVVTDSAIQRQLFSQTHSLKDLTSLKQAKAKPAFWLERLAAKIAATVISENVQTCDKSGLRDKQRIGS